MSLMRYRYLIEVSGDEYEPFTLTTITKDDSDGSGHRERSVEAAKETAAKDPNLDGPIRWKPAPEAWQPDSLVISQWIDDGVEDSHDS